MPRPPRRHATRYGGERGHVIVSPHAFRFECLRVHLHYPPATRRMSVRSAACSPCTAVILAQAPIPALSRASARCCRRPTLEVWLRRAARLRWASTFSSCSPVRWPPAIRSGARTSPREKGRRRSCTTVVLVNLSHGAFRPLENRSFGGDAPMTKVIATTTQIRMVGTKRTVHSRALRRIDRPRPIGRPVRAPHDLQSRQPEAGVSDRCATRKCSRPTTRRPA